MHIDWASVAAVAVVAAAATVTVVLLIAVAVVNISSRAGRRNGGGLAPTDVGAAAALCVLAAGALVAYGVYLLIA